MVTEAFRHEWQIVSHFPPIQEIQSLSLGNELSYLLNGKEDFIAFYVRHSITQKLDIFLIITLQ